MTEIYSETQLDTLREVANIGAGTASTALAQLLHRPVDISVPHAEVLPLADGVAALGERGALTGVLVPVAGDVPAIVLAVVTGDERERLCDLLGAGCCPELASSALSEAGYILACHYLGSLEKLTGFALEPLTPQLVSDEPPGALGAAVVTRLRGADVALFIDTQLTVEGDPCGLSFLFVPGADAAAALLTRLGVA